MSLDVKLAETKALLKTVRHASMATVNVDGSPHNTPYFFMYDSDFKRLYWGSHTEAQHTKNIQHNSRIFVVAYDTHQQGMGGLYITAHNAAEISGAGLLQALTIQNSFRKKYGKDELPLSYYTDTEQRLYAAEVQKLEVYAVERDQDGRIVREVRKQVTSDQLL